MSAFHCSCGFAIDQPEEFADHLHQAFARGDDIGTDGHVHRELADESQAPHACACGFITSDLAELDDHMLIVFITPDGIGTDGARHVPEDPATPDRWYIRRHIDD